MAANEIPQTRARRLMDEIDTRAQDKFTKGDVKLLLNNIAQMPLSQARPEAPDAEGCRAPVLVESIRRGDVFIAKTIGGKVRPWVVLHVSGDVVTATGLSSSESAPGLLPSQCRYWPDAWLGGAVCTFARETATAEVTRPYTARQHLSEVEAAFLSNFGKKRKATVRKLALVRAAQ